MAAEIIRVGMVLPADVRVCRECNVARPLVEFALQGKGRAFRCQVKCRPPNQQYAEIKRLRVARRATPWPSVRAASQLLVAERLPPLDDEGLAQCERLEPYIEALEPAGFGKLACELDQLTAYLSRVAGGPITPNQAFVAAISYGGAPTWGYPKEADSPVRVGVICPDTWSGPAGSRRCVPCDRSFTTEAGAVRHARSAGHLRSAKERRRAGQ